MDRNMCMLTACVCLQYFFYKPNKLVGLAFKEDCYHSG